MISQIYPGSISTAIFCTWAQRTKDRLYESKDSREIENGSISPAVSLLRVDVEEGFERLGQKLFFSGGEGYKLSQ